MPVLDLLNYRGMECEHLGGHPAGRTADLACLAEGVLRGRALEEPACFSRKRLSHLIRGAAVEAILDGTEKITRDTLDRIGLDQAAETTRTRRRSAARRHGTPS